MDLDLDLPPSPSRSTSSNLHPPTSGQPMRIPESFESVIQRTVMERLTLNSTELVQAAVSGVVDACIPRLVELIVAKIASFASDRTQGSRTPLGCGNDGWEDDNEDKSPSPKGRKKPGPHGHRNHLHVWHFLTPGHQLMVSQSAYRKYLTEKGVMTTRSSKGLTPVQAPPNQVEAFNQDRSSPSTIKSVAIDWTTSLKSSPWNQETVHLLAADFHAKLKIGTYPTIVYDVNCMSVNTLGRLCVQKLSRTHDACRRQAEVDSQPIEQQQEAISKLSPIRTTQLKNDRSTAWRLGICYQSYVCTYVHSLTS